MQKKFVKKLIVFLIVGISGSAGALEMTPTIYSLVSINADNMSCEPSELRPVKNRQGATLIELCSNEFGACQFEGTCRVTSIHGDRLLNLITSDAKAGETVFAELNLGRCRFGLGLRDICLDPFYSVAADRKEFKLGEVIFVPAMKGLSLPDGTKHDGYLIVRDGTHLLDDTGPARLHFFTGNYRAESRSNPFALKLKLDDPQTRMEFERVTEATAAKVRAQRNFPLLPGVASGEKISK